MWRTNRVTFQILRTTARQRDKPADLRFHLCDRLIQIGNRIPACGQFCPVLFRAVENALLVDQIWNQRRIGSRFSDDDVDMQPQA